MLNLIPKGLGRSRSEGYRDFTDADVARLVSNYQESNGNIAFARRSVEGMGQYRAMEILRRVFALSEIEPVRPVPPNWNRKYQKSRASASDRSVRQRVKAATAATLSSVIEEPSEIHSAQMDEVLRMCIELLLENRKLRLGGAR